MKPYYYCPKKWNSRLKIIEAWQGWSGANKVPENLQYWALSGPLGEEKIEPGSELGQMITLGFIKPNQYHGVDFDESVYSMNLRNIKKQYQEKSPCVYNDDIRDVFDQQLSEGNFRPAIVNLDTLHYPELAASLLGSVLNTVNETSGLTIVSFNVVLSLKHRGTNFPSSSILEKINKDAFCSKQLSKGKWFRYDPFVYNGTGIESRTTMGTIIFARNTDD